MMRYIFLQLSLAGALIPLLLCTGAASAALPPTIAMSNTANPGAVADAYLTHARTIRKADAPIVHLLSQDAYTQGTKTGDIQVLFYNAGVDTLPIEVTDPVYGQAARKIQLAAGQTQEMLWNLQSSHHWYDLIVSTPKHHWRMAGHVENGDESWSDPANTKPVLAL